MATSISELDRVTITLDTAPTSTAITLAEAKDHCRITTTDDDAYVTALIEVATSHVQNVTHRQLMTATRVLYIDEWVTPIELPYPPLQSVTHVKYYDTGAVQQTLTVTTDYIVDVNSTPGRVTLPSTASWPTTQDIWNAIEVKYVCGYASASAVPVMLKHALKFIVAHLYDRREPVGDGRAMTVLPYGLDTILAPFRVPLM